MNRNTLIDVFNFVNVVASDAGRGSAKYIVLRQLQKGFTAYLLAWYPLTEGKYFNLRYLYGRMRMVSDHERNLKNQAIAELLAIYASRIQFYYGKRKKRNRFFIKPCNQQKAKCLSKWRNLVFVWTIFMRQVDQVDISQYFNSRTKRSTL